jgi:hypothetical protein
MKPNTKISFTSVLKSKSNLNGGNGNSISSNNNKFSQHFSTSSQNYTSTSNNRLIDIYEQYETYPEQNYTLNLNVQTMHNKRGRNNSLMAGTMIKSRNNICEDPEMNLDQWIESQAKSKGKYTGNMGGQMNNGNMNFQTNNSRGRFSQNRFKVSINQQPYQNQQQYEDTEQDEENEYQNNQYVGQPMQNMPQLGQLVKSRSGMKNDQYYQSNYTQSQQSQESF